MRIGSLFSGIGGLELGLEWAGVGHTVWQVEQSEFCRTVLAKQWPDAQRFTDVREVGASNLAPVDVICGGFPCQDVSHLGKRKGMGKGTRSGLWSEFARILTELRPSYVIVENTIGLESLGLSVVLSDLRALGYSGERCVLSACAVGGSHARRRLFVLAYAGGVRVGGNGTAGAARPLGARGERHAGRTAQDERWLRWPVDRPRVLGSPNGVPHQMDRNRALGNAVVPQVAKVVGERLLAIHRASLAEAA